MEASKEHFPQELFVVHFTASQRLGYGGFRILSCRHIQMFSKACESSIGLGHNTIAGVCSKEIVITSLKVLKLPFFDLGVFDDEIGFRHMRALSPAVDDPIVKT